VCLCVCLSLLNSPFFRTDIVLQDFCSVVGLDSGSHERVYFRQILPEGIEEEGNLGVCSEAEVDLQWKTRASTCTPIDSSSALSLSIGNFLAICIFYTWAILL
jgi:hypothetical protein